MNISKINKKDVTVSSFIKKFHILSIDVLIGAIASGAFAVEVLKVRPGFAWWIVLPLSVWIVYSLDHIIDSVKRNATNLSIRQLFFKEHSKWLWIIIFLFSILTAFLVLYSLDTAIVEFGMVIGFVTSVYFLLLVFLGEKKSIFLQKELFVAAIYTAGIWGGPMALMKFQLNHDQLILLINFLLLVFSDILILNFYEAESDKKNNPNSFILKYGKRFSYYFIWILIIVVFSSSLVEVILVQDVKLSIAFKLLMLMSIVLLILFNYRDKFRQWPYYRLVGEIVFWIPVVLLLFSD